MAVAKSLSPVLLSYTSPATMARFSPPPSSRKTCSSFPAVEELITTLSPCAKKWRAISLPMPDEAPVTMIVCFFILYSLSGGFCGYTYREFEIVVDQRISQVFKKITGAEFYTILGTVDHQFAGCNQRIAINIHSGIESDRL